MNVKKSLLVAGAVAAVGVTGVTGLGVASAATGSSAEPREMSSLVDKLVEKFNLNRGEVEAVFEDQRAEREAAMQQRVEERLNKAVSEGKLTEEQKGKILAKLAEIRAEHKDNHEALKDMTKEERRAHGEQQRKALEAWADENNIPMEYLHRPALVRP